MSGRLLVEMPDCKTKRKLHFWSVDRMTPAEWSKLEWRFMKWSTPLKLKFMASQQIRLYMMRIIKRYIPLWFCCGMCFVVEQPIAASIHNREIVFISRLHFIAWDKIETVKK